MYAERQLPVALFTFAAQDSLPVGGALVEGFAHLGLTAVAFRAHIHVHVSVINLTPEIRFRLYIDLAISSIWARFTSRVLVKERQQLKN